VFAKAVECDFDLPDSEAETAAGCDCREHVRTTLVIQEGIAKAM
jgi:hypothetical protein